MNKMSFILSMFLLFSFFQVDFQAEAQEKGKPSIKFKETLFDFGMIQENGGPVSHEFHFENIGSGNLVIHSAKAECGCTKPEFPKEGIAPGKKGVIKVTYNPAGRPGGFTKVVTIRCNGTPGKVILKIRGTVNPSSKTLSERFPVEKGGLRFENDKISAGELKIGQRRHSFLGIYNSRQDSVTPYFTTSGKGLEVTVAPKKIAPGETATVTFYLNSSQLPKAGFQDFIVQGKWGETNQDTLNLKYQAIVMPDVSGPENLRNFN